MTLGEFLQRTLPSAWNCSTEAADWCVVLGHPDFASEWRSVTDPAECEHVAAAGLVDLWKDGIGDGLPEAWAPYQAGDIAVVSAHGHEAGAIFTGERWCFRSDRRRHFMAPEAVAVLKAWRP